VFDWDRVGMSSFNDSMIQWFLKSIHWILLLISYFALSEHLIWPYNLSFTYPYIFHLPLYFSFAPILFIYPYTFHLLLGTPDFEGQIELYVYNLVNIIGEREEKVIYLKTGIKGSLNKIKQIKYDNKIYNKIYNNQIYDIFLIHYNTYSNLLLYIYF
jgi:hypothetical protein